MELKEYLKTFRRYWFAIAALTLLGAALGAFWAKQMPTGFANTQTFFLSPAPGQTNLEAHYAQEKARSFTDSAIAIISSGDFKSQTLNPGETLSAKKLAPQVLELITFAPDPTRSKKLTQETVALINTRFGANMTEIAPAGEPSYAANPKIIYLIAGALSGLAFAVFAISLKTYFKI